MPLGVRLLLPRDLTWSRSRTETKPPSLLGFLGFHLYAVTRDSYICSKDGHYEQHRQHATQLVPNVMLLRVTPKLLALAILGLYYLFTQVSSEFAWSDFVVALASSSDRLALAQGTRSFRRGIRTFITTSNQTEVDALNLVLGKYNETYAYFPVSPEDGMGGWGRAWGREQGLR